MRLWRGLSSRRRGGRQRRRRRRRRVSLVERRPRRRQGSSHSPTHTQVSEMPNAEQSEDIQEMREGLMGMGLDELKMFVLAKIKKVEPDVELPGGGKEEIVAWVIEWQKAREAEEEKKRVKDDARLSIVEPHKGAPEQLYPFLQANPNALPTFIKGVVTDPTHAAWLGEAVKAAPALAGLTDADGQNAFAFAHWECKQAFEII